LFGSLSFSSHFLCEFFIMNTGLLCLSPIDIMFCIINKSCSCGFSTQLARNCHRESIAHCSRKYG
jgi:hypothetical protein